MDSNNMNGANVNQQVSYQIPQGTPQPQYQQAQYQQPQYQQAPNPYAQPAAGGYQAPQIPENYKPISAWGYVGYTLLFCIPLVGLIMLIVFSFSDANINRRNYARSYWCMLLLSIIITVIITILSVALGYSFLAAFG